MGLGLTKEEFQKYSSNPQQDIERQNALNFIEAIYNDETSKMNAQPKPVASVPQNVNPNLSDEQKISALNFIETIYNDEVNKINGASQTTSNSTSTPSTSTLPVLKKSADAPIKKEEKKPNLKLVSDAQKSREQAIADAVRVNRVGESQNARQKAIDEARQREIDRNTVKKEEENVPTQIYDTDLMGNDISVGTLTKATPTPTAELENGIKWAEEQAIKNKYRGASPVNVTTEDVAKGVEQGLKEGQAFTKQVYEDRAKETIGETLKKWSNPNYKLTKRDKETFSKKLDEADEKYGVANWWNYQGQQKIKKAIEDGKLTQEEANAYRDISIKLNPYLSYVSGVLSKTGGELVTSFAVAREKAINKIAGTDYTAAQDARDAFNRELQNAQTQNRVATGVGQFVGMGAEYALANKMLSGIGGEGLKWNLLRGQMADTALQTAPMVANNIFDEKYKKEDGSFDIPQLVADIGKDEAANLIMNGAFEVAPKIINPIIEGKVADRLENQNVDDVVSNAIKNNEETPKTISQIGEDIQNANISQVRKQPKRVGKFTTIQSPYDGEIPTQKIKERKRVIIPNDDLENANTNMEVSSIDNKLLGVNQKKLLTKVYETLFKNENTAFDVAVDDMNFKNQIYNVTVNKNAIGKICSDPNMSAEKLSVIDNLKRVIKDSEFVGSGDYVDYKNTGKHKNVIRYDYFETDVKINGKDYVVTFDVEVVPGQNNYRTHKIINEINLTPSSVETGPVPAAHEVESGLFDTIIPKEISDVNTTNGVPTIETKALK